MAQYYVNESDLPIINKILERGHEVLIKKDREVLKICEKNVSVSRKKHIYEKGE